MVRRQTVEYGRQALTSTTSHSITAHTGLSHTHGVWAAALERWDLRKLSVVCLVYIRELCAHMPTGENRQHVTDTHVQNNASRTETREVVVSTPAGNKKGAPAMRFRVHGWHRDLYQCVRPGFMCPSTYCFAEKCSCEEKSWQKYEKLTNIRIHIYG